MDIFSRKEEKIKLDYIGTSGNFGNCGFVGDININYQNTNKEDIYFKVVDLINSNLEESSFIYFETNVTNLDKIKTAFFRLQIAEGVNTVCFFHKS